MNSWHSFSPNGRWLVFSSKSRSPYTQMFLTHIDVPAAEFCRLFDRAWGLAEKGRRDEAVAEWRKAVALNPAFAPAHFNLGNALAARGLAVARHQLRKVL